MTPIRLAVLAAVLTTSFASTACKEGSEGAGEFDIEGQKVRTATGEIESIAQDGKTAKIAHDDIEGFMKAMTMEFAFQEPKLSQGLEEGDRIEFDFAMTPSGTLVIVSVKPAQAKAQ